MRLVAMFNKNGITRTKEFSSDALLNDVWDWACEIDSAGLTYVVPEMKKDVLFGTLTIQYLEAEKVIDNKG
jgi:hypothetical protein